MYSRSIKLGKDYLELEKTIVILISDYELKSLKNIPQYSTKWQIREEKYMLFYIIRNNPNVT